MKHINYKVSFDEDNITISAYKNNEKIGTLIMKILIDSYYEFEDVFDEEEFYNLYPEDEIIKIEHIEIDNTYKNLGIAKELMNRGMRIMKDKGYNQFYLNASPMGFSGLKLEDLVNFYKKFGFEELLNQGNNVLMKAIFKNNN